MDINLLHVCILLVEGAVTIDIHFLWGIGLFIPK